MMLRYRYKKEVYFLSTIHQMEYTRTGQKNKQGENIVKNWQKIEGWFRRLPNVLILSNRWSKRLEYVYPRVIVVGLCQTLHEEWESITQTRKQKLMNLKREMMTRLYRQSRWWRHPISARAVVFDNKIERLMMCKLRGSQKRSF